jgi:hypothetical protein
MRVASIYVFMLLALSVAANAKPKVSVKVQVAEEITNLMPPGDLSSLSGGNSRAVTYLNVIVVPDTPIDNFRNDGKWCIKTQAGQKVQLAKGGEYKGFLDGDFLDLDVPLAKGKPVKVAFVVFDRKWRSRLDIK